MKIFVIIVSLIISLQVFLQMKHGVEAKNYENLGDAAKLKPLEVELKRLEDLSESIVQDFAFMRRREVLTNYIQHAWHSGVLTLQGQKSIIFYQHWEEFFSLMH